MKINKYSIRFGKYLNGNLAVRVYKDKLCHARVSIKVDEILDKNHFYFDIITYPDLLKLLLNSGSFINKNVYFDKYPLIQYKKINKNALFVSLKPLF